MKESIDEKSLKCHVMSKRRKFLASEWFTSFSRSREPNRCFIGDDRRALVTLQLSVFCDTAYHAAFAIEISIRPFCCFKNKHASLLFLGFSESVLSIDQETLT